MISAKRDVVAQNGDFVGKILPFSNANLLPEDETVVKNNSCC